MGTGEQSNFCEAANLMKRVSGNYLLEVRQKLALGDARPREMIRGNRISLR